MKNKKEKEAIIKKPSKPYVIAEIGNNHQGRFDLAVRLIEEAASCGVDAVKFQTRANRGLYTDQFFNQPYINKNSFGCTYGEHRENLELGIETLKKLFDIANENGIDCFSTPFDLASVEELEKIGCPIYKVASADIVHIPLIERIARTHKPILISTGHSTWTDIDRCLEHIPDSTDITILHCTAAYPASIEDMNLSCITEFIRRYGHTATIGLSDHENGIDAASVAYMLGARVFEKHFTLDRSWKGTDNPFSLEPEGMKKLVRNLKRIPILLGSPKKCILESEKGPVNKMRKSLVYADSYEAGTTVSPSMVEYRCPGDGLEPYHINNILSKVLKVDVVKHQIVSYDHLSDVHE